jgi:hypothetical protein
MTDDFTKRTRALRVRRNHRGQRPTLRASTCALAALLTLSHLALGQTPAEQGAAPIDESVDLEAPPRAQTWSLFAGYTSHELSNPGFHFGTEYPLASTAHFQSIVSGSFQAYYQQNTETGVALHARWGQRYTSSWGFTFESFLGVGAQYTEYAWLVFKFDDSTGTAMEGAQYRLAFSPHIVFGPGYDFDQLLALPLHVYARPGVVMVYPDLNETFQAFVIAEIGMRWVIRGE